MNEQPPIKRTNKWLIVLIILIALIIILIPLIIAITGLVIVPKMIEKVENKAGNPNYFIQGLSVYIPMYWKEENNFHISTSGNCKIIGGTTIRNQNELEKDHLEEEIEHEEKNINDIDMSYGFKDNGKEKIYSYYFEDYSHKYFILFVNNNNSDIECNEYLEKLEHSITLDPKGEEL